MKFTKFQTFPIRLSGLLIAISSRTITAERVVPPGQSIAEAVKDAIAAGVQSPRFNLHAERAGSETDYEVNVRVATPAVTHMTTVSAFDGESKNVDEDDVATMLVGYEEGVLALIAIDKRNGSANGIVQKDGEKMKLTQNGKRGKVSLFNEKGAGTACHNNPSLSRRF
jgi:hypothetical protein